MMLVSSFKKKFATLAFFVILLAGAAAAADNGPTPADQRLEWYRQHAAMKEASLFKALEWRFFGPTIMSGRICDVDSPRGSRHTIFAASASGGLWRSVNEGTTWEAVFEEGPATTVGDIAISRSHPRTMYIGLGEPNTYRSSYSGTGVYRSVDGGDTWTHLGLSDTHHIGRIVIHPENPDIVYVAALGHQYTFNRERGVFKTTDGGDTWKKVFYIDEKTGVIDLAMDPADPDILYASAGERLRRAWHNPVPEFGNPGRGVFLTRDAGETWSPANTGLPDLKMTGRIGLDVTPAKPGLIYAVVDNHNRGRKARPGTKDPYGNAIEYHIRGLEVYRSDDHADTWVKVSRDDRALERMFSSYGYVFGQIRVDPNDENTVYIHGTSLLKSTDGGETFQNLNYRDLHGDHHAQWIDPEDSDHIINGNDGGVNISYDGGRSWRDIDNLGVVQFYNVAVDMSKPFRACGSIQDNGTFMGPSTHNPDRHPNYQWESVPGGEASYVAFDPREPDRMYSASFFGRIMRTDLSKPPYKSKNLFTELFKEYSDLRGNWLAAFTLSSHNPDVVYLGQQFLFKSADRGETWAKISPDLSYNDPQKRGDVNFGNIVTISESPLKAGLIYVGTDDGRIHVTSDDGAGWNEIIDGLPRHKWISRVEASRFDEGTVYASLNGYRDDDFAVYLYKSTDFGTTWQDISANIPGAPVNVVREDPKNPSLLYVGTDLGVYVSLNGGAEWQVLGGNLPSTYVHDLVVHPRDDKLVIATHGRGMWILDKLTPLRKQIK